MSGKSAGNGYGYVAPVQDTHYYVPAQVATVQDTHYYAPASDVQHYDSGYTHNEPAFVANVDTGSSYYPAASADPAWAADPVYYPAASADPAWAADPAWKKKK